MTGVKVPWWIHLRGFKPIGAHIENTDISNAVILVPPDGATKLLIQVMGADIRYTLGGIIEPTKTLGFQLKKDDPPRMITIEEGIIITIIEESPSASLQYHWGN
jgi:hypothetical protein